MSVYLSTLVPGVARAEPDGAGWKVTKVLSDVDVRVLAPDPRDLESVWAGTEGGGVLRSIDAGASWTPAGLGGKVVKALAVSPAGRIYAGTNPAAIFASEDEGSSWRELVGFRRVRRWFWFSPAERPFSAYVLGLALDRETVIAGIEAGAVVRSTDGGETWQHHRPGALRDCHSLATAPGRFYEAGGSGGGAARSIDGGLTWTRPAGHDRHYGWASAGDPVDPDLWYFSAAPGIRAHSDDAGAAIYRCRGDRAVPVAGGRPNPLRSMPYALIAGPEPGSLVAGFANGEVRESADAGDSWRPLLRLPAISRALIRVGNLRVNSPG
jgi:photosystem II stability/assembly factor-like uncharacterized protein